MKRSALSTSLFTSNLYLLFFFTLHGTGRARSNHSNYQKQKLPFWLSQLAIHFVNDIQILDCMFMYSKLVATTIKGNLFICMIVSDVVFWRTQHKWKCFTRPSPPNPIQKTEKITLYLNTNAKRAIFYNRN